MESRDHRNKPRRRRRAATVIESVDELTGRPGLEPTVQEGPKADERPAPRAPAPPTFRPSLRPPMAILCACDDGLITGEAVRIRAASFVIGRSDGDLVIPHDAGMSGRHAEIARRVVDGQYKWSLRDVGSTNGTFIRAARASLDDGQELLIGGLRLRFDSPGGSSPPRLVEIGPRGEGRSYPIPGPETWIGRDPRRCAIVLDGPWVGPRHAAIRARSRGRWMIEKGEPGDGVWLRIGEVDLGRGGQFQCGEQRFVFRVM